MPVAVIQSEERQFLVSLVPSVEGMHDYNKELLLARGTSTDVHRSLIRSSKLTHAGFNRKEFNKHP